MRGVGLPRPQLMPKKPTRMLSIVLAGSALEGALGVAVGAGAGVAGVGGGVGVGVLAGFGVGVGVGAGVGVAVGDGRGVGAGVGVAVGDGLPTGTGVHTGPGLTGVPPAGRAPVFTRIRSGRVGISSVIVQPQAVTTANPAIHGDILIGTSLESR